MRQFFWTCSSNFPSVRGRNALNSAQSATPWKTGQSRFRSWHINCPLFIWLAFGFCFCLSLSARAIGKAAEVGLQIGLGQGIPSITLRAPQGAFLINSRGKTVKMIRPGEALVFDPSARRRRPNSDSFIGQTIRFQPRGNLFEVNGKPYRGSARIAISSRGVDLVNLIGVEDYIRGVVGAEVGSMSPVETLRAQAVIARTYAIANRGKHGNGGFDLCSNEHCQAYGGVKAERPSTDEAVRFTRGIIMISDGIPISTLYHATCGGMTSDNEKVFGGNPTKYLRRVKCPFCKGGLNYRWNRRIPPADLVRALNNDGHSCNSVFKTRLESPAPLDRVEKMIFSTDRGEFPVKGTTFRRWFNLPSTTFAISDAGRKLVARGETALTVPERFQPPDLIPKSAGLSLLALQGNKDEIPEQLLVFSGTGLRRVSRPNTGWMVLAFKSEKSKQIQGKKNSLQPPFAAQVPALSGDLSSLDRHEIDKVVLSKTSGGSSLNIVGRGYGHQVGLCQSGAVELGKRRWSYRQILAFYYSRVTLRKLSY